MNPLTRLKLGVRRVFYRGDRVANRAAHPTTGTTGLTGTHVGTGTTGVGRTHARGHWGRKFRRAMFWRRRPHTTVAI